MTNIPTAKPESVSTDANKPVDNSKLGPAEAAAKDSAAPAPQTAPKV